MARKASTSKRAKQDEKGTEKDGDIIKGKSAGISTRGYYWKRIETSSSDFDSSSEGSSRTSSNFNSSGTSSDFDSYSEDSLECVCRNHIVDNGNDDFSCEDFECSCMDFISTSDEEEIKRSRASIRRSLRRINEFYYSNPNRNNSILHDIFPFYNNSDLGDFDLESEDLFPGAERYRERVVAYLRGVQDRATTTPPVRARIDDFIRFLNGSRSSSIIELCNNFKFELSGMTGISTSEFPSHDGVNYSNRPVQGLSDPDIFRLPRHIYRGQTQKEKRLNEPLHKCCICMAELEVGEDCILLEGCKHRFHGGCLESWLRKSNQCPICRAEVVPPPPAPILLN